MSNLTNDVHEALKLIGTGLKVLDEVCVEDGSILSDADKAEIERIRQAYSTLKGVM